MRRPIERSAPAARRPFGSRSARDTGGKGSRRPSQGIKRTRVCAPSWTLADQTAGDAVARVAGRLRPEVVGGGVDDEGANNLVAQRLTGVLLLDGFVVSHTKDAVLFEGDEALLDFTLVTATNRVVNTAGMYFQAIPGNDPNTLTMRLSAGDGRHLDFTYTLSKDDYMVKMDIKGTGLNGVLSPSTNALDINWEQKIRPRAEIARTSGSRPLQELASP